jgi:hypothetical protein
VQVRAAAEACDSVPKLLSLLVESFRFVNHINRTLREREQVGIEF